MSLSRTDYACSPDPLATDPAQGPEGPSDAPRSDRPDMANSDIQTDLKYGERHIREGKLITFPNPRLGGSYTIHITLPEFTCKCPFSGYPDFATIDLTYIPNEQVVELKALKLYINSYRDRYISHEEVVNQILDDFVATCDPLEATIKGDFTPRGNVHTVIEAKHRKGDPLPPS